MVRMNIFWIYNKLVRIANDGKTGKTSFKLDVFDLIFNSFLPAILPVTGKCHFRLTRYDENPVSFNEKHRVGQ